MASLEVESVLAVPIDETAAEATSDLTDNGGAQTEQHGKAHVETTEIDEAKPDNEYSYLQRNEFTSEIYKIEVRNLGYFGIGEFKKLLKQKLKLDMTKIKSPMRKEFAFVCFRTQEDQERAIKTLNGYKWKGKELKANLAKASADPLIKRRNENTKPDDGPEVKRQRTSLEATCPLASMPYEEQLSKKTEDVESFIKKYINELRRVNPDAKKHLANFKFGGVIASPEINGYRNKNEFTVGKNAAGEIVVGFRLGSYSDGSVEVSEVQTLPHLPEKSKWAARTFQEFVQQSKFLPFNPESNSGHFRQLMVRNSATTGELMLVAGIYSSNLNETELLALKADLREFYENYKSDEQHKCTSLYYQDVKHREAGQVVNPVEHLSGTTHITDCIQGLKFRISPLAFFQINTQGADLLYKEAIALAAPKPESVVLDICCGTGTIALAFAKHCKKVLGVEIIPDAIKDAEYNAQANNITNCKFYAGNADDYIKSMVREVVYDNAPGTSLDLIAVVDPPRAGLHTRSITAIRAATDIKRLVYVACNAERAKRNFIELARPESKQYKGDPFYPVTAVCVDMFPHTDHKELLILFERGGSSSQATTVAAKSESVGDTDVAEVETAKVEATVAVAT